MRKTTLIISMLFSIWTLLVGNLSLKHRADIVYICVSPTDHKYHKDRDCRGLTKCAHEIKKLSKAEATKMGYAACKIC